MRARLLRVKVFIMKFSLYDLPKPVLTLVKEAARHILKRPVVGVAAVAAKEGKYILIRRADTGTWGLPGGTLEWGESLRESLKRELFEEAGILAFQNVSLVGVYSKPERDLRFHAVTVLVRCEVTDVHFKASNPLEILEVKSFSKEEIPSILAYTQEDMVQDAFRDELIFE